MGEQEGEGVGLIDLIDAWLVNNFSSFASTFMGGQEGEGVGRDRPQLLYLIDA